MHFVGLTRGSASCHSSAWDSFLSLPPWLFLDGSSSQSSNCWEVFCCSARPGTWWGEGLTPEPRGGDVL